MKHIFDDASLSKKQAITALALTDVDHLKEYKYKAIDMFTYGGRKFLGVYEHQVLRFVKDNPTGGDFYVWLQNQGIEVKFH